MSFVVFAGCKYFGVMFGDKRCVNNNGIVLNENTKKVYKINENIIIGAGGEECLIKQFLDTILNYQKTNKLSGEICLHLILQKFNYLLPEIEKIITDNPLLVNLGILSNSNNIIEFIQISINNINIDFKTHQLITDDDIIMIYIANGNGELGNICDNLFKRSGNIFSLTNLKSIFYKTLKLGTNFDFSINDSFNFEYLVRSDIYDEKRDRKK